LRFCPPAYPYLKDEDIEFAPILAKAYPRMCQWPPETETYDATLDLGCGALVATTTGHELLLAKLTPAGACVLSKAWEPAIDGPIALRRHRSENPFDRGTACARRTSNSVLPRASRYAVCR